MGENSFLNGVLSNYVDFFYSLGYFGEYITFFITCGLIYNQYIYLIFFIIAYVLNKLLNQYLKNSIKQDRPANPVKFLDTDKFFKNKFGMPSGHSQNTFFSIMYAYLVTNSFISCFLLLLIGLIVIYERYKYRNHTLNQLIVGAGVGVTFAYLTYSFTRFVIKRA